MKASKALGWALVLAGVWQIAAPFVLAVNAAPWAAHAVLLGVVWAAFGLWIGSSGRGDVVKLLGWLAALLGLWALAAPAVLGYARVFPALLNDVLVGFVVMVLGAWAAYNAPDDQPAPQPVAHH